MTVKIFRSKGEYRKGILLFLNIAIMIFMSLAFQRSVNAAYLLPLEAGSYSVTSEFGERVHPVTYQVSFHYGIDLGSPMGQRVNAVDSGEVVETGYNETAGNYVKIQHSDNVFTRYLHLNSIDVGYGDMVTSDDQIGTVGTTGLSTGPHLHFEINVDGEPRNPRNYISFGGESVEIPTGDYPISMYAITHQTGMITLYNDGYYPLQIYKSIDRQNWTFMSTLTQNMYTEYGLNNSTTYYYKLKDKYGREVVQRYTPPITSIQVLPLQVIQIDDTTVHLRWDSYEYEKTVYVNGNAVVTGLSANEYTVDNLEPKTQYEIYTINRINERSNTVIVKTTDRMNKLEKTLDKVFSPPPYQDSDNDGLQDYLEPLTAAMDAIKKAAGMDAINEAQDIINSMDFSDFKKDSVEAMADIPKMTTDYMGIEIKVLDLESEWFLDIAKSIRALVLAVLVCSFILVVLGIFNLTFKV
jgi:hypothetical protein